MCGRPDEAHPILGRLGFRKVSLSGLDHGQELVTSGGHSGFVCGRLLAIVEPESIAQSRSVRIFVFG